MRVTFLDGELLETLKAQWEKRKVFEVPGYPTCPYVFSQNGRLIGDIRDVWHNACLAAGLGQMIEIEWGGKKKKKYVGKLFHDFRRTGCRDISEPAFTNGVAMRISGHKTRSVFDRYNIVSPNALRRQHVNVQSICNSKRKESVRL